MARRMKLPGDWSREERKAYHQLKRIVKGTTIKVTPKKYGRVHVKGYGIDRNTMLTQNTLISIHEQVKAAKRVRKRLR